MKLFKYISILSALTLALAGCIRDNVSGPVAPVGLGSDGASIALSFDIPETFGPSAEGPATRNGAQVDEKIIETLDLLVVEDLGSGTLFIRKRIPLDVSKLNTSGDFKTIEVNIPVVAVRVGNGDILSTANYKFVLFANGSMRGASSDTETDILTKGTIPGQYETYLNKLIANMPANPDRIPMWGMTEASYKIPNGTSNPAISVPTIQMIRAFAKFDIETHSSLDGILDVKAVYPVNSYASLLVTPYYHPNDPAYSYVTRSVRRVSLPNQGSPRPGKSTNISKSGNIRTWYLPEHDNTAVDPADELSFIIKADYGPAGQRVTDRYYKVRLLNEDGDLFDILRNHHYAVTVMEVTGPGYDTEAEALASDVYIQAKVVEWETVTGDVIFDGTHRLEVSHPRLDICKEAGYVLIDIETDFPGMGDKSGNTPDDLPAGLWVDPASGLTLTDVTAGSEVAVDALNDDHLLKRTIKVSWDENTSASIESGIAVTVEAGNMTYVIKYAQSPEPWLTIPEFTRVPTDGRFHTIDPVTEAEWTAAVTGTTQAMGLMDLLAHTSASSNDNKVHFQVDNLPMYYGVDEVELTFTNEEYHYPLVKGTIFFGPTAPSLTGRGVVPVTKGLPASEGILAVNNLGRLNLDGQKYVGAPGTGITHNYAVLFKYGSLVGITADVTGDTYSYPDDIAWIPPTGYGTGGYNMSAASSFGSVPSSTTNIDNTAPDTANATGDPCKLAAKDNVEGGWRMPRNSANSGSVYEPIPSADALGAWTTLGGAPGRYGTIDGQFYPATGFRLNNSGEMLQYQQVAVYYSYSSITAKQRLATTNSLIYLQNSLSDNWNYFASSVRCVTTEYDDLPGAAALIQAPPGVIGIRHSDLVAFRAGTKTPADYSLTVKGSNRFAGEPFADIAGGVEDEPVYMVYFKWGKQVAILGEPAGSGGTYGTDDVVWWPTQSRTGVNYSLPASWAYDLFPPATPVTVAKGAVFSTTPANAMGDPCHFVDGGTASKPASWRTPSAAGTTYSWTSTTSHSGTYTPFGSYSADVDLGATTDQLWANMRNIHGAKANSVNTRLQGVLTDDEMMFLPYAGCRGFGGSVVDGAMYWYGKIGLYWTDSGNAYGAGLSTGAYSVTFNATNIHPSKDFWTYSALPIRCVSWTPPAAPTPVPPTEGVDATEEGILAVNNLGQLNLDGNTRIGTGVGANRITTNKLVYFRYGSLVAISGDDDPTDAYDPLDIAWLPGGYTGSIPDTYNEILYTITGEMPAVPDEAGLKGDPCMLAMKNGVQATGWRMPKGNPYELVPTNTSMGAETTVGGIKGRPDLNGRFYPYAGFRNYAGVLQVINQQGYYWAHGNGGTPNPLTLYNASVNNATPYQARTQAMPIRCVLPGDGAPGTTPPNEGAVAPENILAVNNLGQLNLDGQKYVGVAGTGITSNYTVYFKWDSLVAVAYFDDDTENNLTATYPIAWAPLGYTGAVQGITDWSTIPSVFGNTGIPTAPDFAGGKGDACTLAVKDNAVGGYRMPTGNPYEKFTIGTYYLGSNKYISGGVDYGNGHLSAEGQFYPRGWHVHAESQNDKRAQCALSDSYFSSGNFYAANAYYHYALLFDGITSCFVSALAARYEGNVVRCVPK